MYTYSIASNIYMRQCRYNVYSYDPSHPLLSNVKYRISIPSS